MLWNKTPQSGQSTSRGLSSCTDVLTEYQRWRQRRGWSNGQEADGENDVVRYGGEKPERGVYPKLSF